MRKKLIIKEIILLRVINLYFKKGSSMISVILES